MRRFENALKSPTSPGTTIWVLAKGRGTKKGAVNNEATIDLIGIAPQPVRGVQQPRRLDALLRLRVRAQRRGNRITFVDLDAELTAAFAPDEALNTVSQLLNTLREADLCTGPDALAKLNASLRCSGDGAAPSAPRLLPFTGLIRGPGGFVLARQAGAV